MGISDLIASVIPAAICGFLCACSQGTTERFYDVFQTARAPKELEDYALSPLRMPLEEAANLEDFPTRMETAKVYEDILDYIEKRTMLEETIRDNASVPIGYALSAIGFLYSAFMGTNIIILLACFALSHVFFFKWLNSKRCSTISPVDWECNKYRGEYYADSVYQCVFQARMCIRSYYEIVRNIANTNKTAKQFYLVLAVLVGAITVFPDFF